MRAYTVSVEEAMAANRQRAHHLLDRLAPSQLTAVVHLLETMVVPGEDGGRLSDAARRAIAEADQWLEKNEPIPHAEVLAEFGLTTDDWNRMAEEPLPENPPVSPRTRSSRTIPT